MDEHTLRQCRVLVAEDEYLLAEELRTELAAAGAIVLGPVGTVEDTIALIQSEPHIDGAILDLNLHGEMAFPAADLLVQRHVPFVFATGYDDAAIPARFRNIARYQKPVDLGRITRAIGRTIRV